MAEAGPYELLDSGHGEKLERVGALRLRRPAPQAFWPPSLDGAEWDRVDARYERSSTGGGEWADGARLPEEWPVRHGGQVMLARATGFGHIGLFAEQAPFWHFLREQCRGATAAGREVELLNLFAYTGGSSLAAAGGGARVTHCDASRGLVQWASDNARANGLGDAPVRWIVDDVQKFLRREERRGRRYDAIVLDPPSFGRGPKGEVWKLEEGIVELLAQCRAVLADEPLLFLLSAHTPGVGPLALHGLLRHALAGIEGPSSCGEMSIPCANAGPPLPSGAWAAWAATGDLPRAAGPS